jgi:hypothetical protein
MKKVAIWAAVGLLVTVFTLPAAAMEYSFGGYWRTRGYANRNFTGYDKDKISDPVLKQAGKDARITWIDTRSRLFFTAAINENLKFVNGFEMNATWGDGSMPTVGDDGKTVVGKGKNYGGIGADGSTFEIKHSYADYNLGPMNVKVGVQPGYFARGFLFDDDFAGAVVSYEGEGVSVPVTWMRAFDIDKLHKRDVNYFAVSPSFSAGGVSINPFGLYVYSDNARGWEKTAAYDKMDMYYAGLNIDATLGMASLWLTGIYQGGSADLASNPDTSVDFSAYLGAAGAKVDFGPADVHGQFFYATGQDADKSDEKDKTNFWVPAGQSYYWSEIMGYGIFDAQFSASAPGDQIGNIMAANLGTTIRPTESLEIAIDAWYAKLAEDKVRKISKKDVVIENIDDELGWEANVRITYTLVKGLKLDLVGAYLFAGDGVYNGPDDADPYEIGSQLSLSF